MFKNLSRLCLRLKNGRDKMSVNEREEAKGR